jgi:hypothetical protein
VRWGAEGVMWGGVLRELSESKRNEVTGDWRRLHDEELYDFLLLNKYFL